MKSETKFYVGAALVAVGVLYVINQNKKKKKQQQQAQRARKLAAQQQQQPKKKKKKKGFGKIFSKIAKGVVGSAVPGSAAFFDDGVMQSSAATNSLPVLSNALSYSGISSGAVISSPVGGPE